MGLSAPSLTRSRKSFPGLKCGTYLPDNATASPVFGLRPWRGGRKCSEKLPKPRISMRSPCESASLMISSICFSASSILGWQVLLLRSNDLDEFRFRHELASTHAVRAIVASVAVRTDLFLEQVAEARSPRGRGFGAISLNGLLFIVYFLGLDRQRDRAG